MAAKPYVSGNVWNAADANDCVGVYDRNTTEVDVVNIGTGVNIVAKTIAASAMSTDRLIRCTILGDYLNNSGSSQSFAFSITFGSTIYGDTTTATVPADADRRPFLMRFELANLASASVQILTGTIWIGAAVAGGIAGIGDIDSATYASVFGGSGTANTGSAQSLIVTAQHGAANANLSLRKKYSLIELA